MKKMLTVEEQIEHMKKKGITFKMMPEEEAKSFLLNNNYYMKLASYRANYHKCETGKRAGQYVNLDFAYLKELSTIDMHLRYYIMQMCLDIEHSLKVRLMREISSNSHEDGYECVKKFLAQDQNFNILKKLQPYDKKNPKMRELGEYRRDLIEKYFPYFPAWVFLEIISLGTLTHFCEFYEQMYSVQIVNNKLTNQVRDLRNACAHSNCLLNHLSQKIDETKQPHSEITNFVKNIKEISNTSRRNNLNGLFTYNFVTLLYVYDSLMPTLPKQKRYEDLKEFMENRVVRNKNYFTNNTKIVGTYKFVKKIIDNLYKNAYNIVAIEK